MKAVILAAGSGSRLGAAGMGRPKGLIEIGGVAILDRQIACLRARGITDICIVTGYRFELLEDRFRDRADFRHNPFFDRSNNMVSLLFARDWIDEDALILYADLLYEPEIVDTALNAHGDIAIMVDRTAIEPGHGLVAIRDGLVRTIGRELDLELADARFVGIARFRRRGAEDFLVELDAAAKAGMTDHYYTVGLERLAARGYPIAAIDVGGRRWCEIDSADDLDRARREWR